MGNSVGICERHYAAYVTDDRRDEVNMGIYDRKPKKEGKVLRIPKRA